MVESKLRFLRSRMARVEQTLRDALYSDGAAECTPESCSVPVDSDDEIGEAAASFNRLVEALAESHHVTDVSGEFARTLSSHIEVTSLSDAALGELHSAGGFVASALCVVRDGEMVTVASKGLLDPERVAASEPVSRAYRTLETIQLALPEDIAVDGGVIEFTPRSVIAFPLHLRLVPIGVLLVASTGATSTEEMQLISGLLPNFAVALNNALSHERLQQVAAIDNLTGLFNRRFGLERLSEEFSRAVRSNEPLGVMLFDIDHFKAINDNHGHQAGDRVLTAVAGAARGVLREGDTLMRYGGEEFLAVLPGAGSEDLHDLSERVRRVIETTVVTDMRQELRVTVSIGAVGFPSTEVTDTEDLVRHADAAMYVSKSAGRNRLTMAGR
ncbi:MAG: GGDEF domain-containing protein [Microthrixaceae bacterium]|nr:GGDEF domain-containing protein [Microthrixaceae bacterium]